VPEHWRLDQADFLVDRWIAEDDPPWELRCDLVAWLLAIREDPYRPGTAPVPGMTHPVRVAPVPGHDEVAFAYLVDDEHHVVTGLLIEST
jgi:hypothetical protein